MEDHGAKPDANLAVSSGVSLEVTDTSDLPGRSDWPGADLIRHCHGPGYWSSFLAGDLVLRPLSRTRAVAVVPDVHLGSDLGLGLVVLPTWIVLDSWVAAREAVDISRT